MTRVTKTLYAFRLVIVLSLALLGWNTASATVPSIVMSDHQTLYTTVTSGAYGVAANTRGDVFFADFANNTLDMIPAGSTLPVTPTILLTGMGGPQQVTVDKSGNVYVADQLNGKIYRVPFVNGSYPTGIAVSSFNSSTTGTICAPGVTTDCRLTPITLYASMRFAGVAVDSTGNVYIAEIYDSISTGTATRILKQTPAGVTTAIITNLPGQPGTYTNAQLTVDAAGNLYYTDQTNLYLITTGATPTATIENSSTLTNPSGVTIDPSTGNLIVSDYGHSRIVVIPYESTALNFADQYMLAPYQTRSSVGVDGKGTIYYSSANGSPSAISQMQISTYGVPTLAVNATSAVAYVYTTFNAASTVLNNYAISGHGASIIYTAGTCVLGTTYTTGQSCAYNVSMKPTRVGPVSGTIMDTDASGNVLSQFTLTANATGSAVAIDPGTAAAIGSGYTTPAGVAVDKAGNVFVADRTANTVYELVGGTGTPVALGTGLSGPTGVAVDAAGDLFIADAGNSRVVEIPTVGTVLTTANQIVVASGLTAPIAIATGSLNSLYIAQSASLALYENRGYIAPVQTAVISTAYTSPRAVAVDPSGNIFVADSVLGKVVELANYTYATTTVATGLTVPTGLATDAAGDLFLIDNGAAQAIRIPNISGTLTYGQAVPVGSFTAPYGVGIDELGNLYISDASVPAVYQITRSIGLLNFGTIDDNTTSPALTASLLSSGNQSLTLGTPVDTYSSGDTTHFSLTSGTNCTSGEVLTAGSSCTIAATFTPTTSTTISEVYSLSASPTVAVSPFTLTLSGTGGSLITTTTTVTPSVTTTTFGTSVSVVIAVTPNTGSGTPAGTVILTATPAGGSTITLLDNVTLVNGAYTYTGTLPIGVDSLIATYNGSATYNPSSGTTTVTVAQIIPQISWTPSVITQTYGTTISSSVLDATVASPAGSIAYTSNISTGSCGTTITTSCLLSMGTYTLTATFTPTDTVSYTKATANITYTVTTAPPLSAYVPRIIMSNHQTLYSGLTNGTYSAAANARGDVFFVDFAGNTLDMLPAGTTTPVVLLTGMANPHQVTVDNSGNVYVTDGTNVKVYKVPFVNGSYPTGIVVSTFNSSTTGTICAPGVTTDCRLAPFGTIVGNSAEVSGLSVDGSGNIYLADFYDSLSLGAYTRILKQTPAGVTTIQLNSLPALTGNTNAQLASDSAGNLYYTDTINLYSIPSGSTTVTVKNASTLNKPSGVAIDPAGNLIVSDYGNSRIVVIPAESGALNFSDQYVLAPYAPAGSVGVDGKGTIYYPGNTSGASSISAMQTSVFGVPSLAVGASSTSALVYATYNYPTTFAQYLTLGNGASMGYVANTCVIGNTYAIGQSCSFNTSITPSRVGPVSGVIGIADASGNYLSEFTLTANATGSAVAVDPGTAANIGSGFKKPSGVTVDKAGNVFIADSTANAVYELVGGTGTPVALGTGLSGPTGVAVDASGNLYIADTGNTRVVEIPVAGSVLTTASQAVIASGLIAPIAIATGPLNSLYIAQSGSLASYASRGYTGPVKTAVISTAYTSPRALAVDPSGNIFIADSTLGEVVELANYTYASTVVATGLTMPTGLATDAAGDLFLVDNGAAQATRIPNISGTLTTAQEVSLGSFTAPYGVGIDELGNLYISDTSVPAVYKISRTTGLLNFGTVNVNSTSPAHTASLISSGNQSLTLGTPVDTYSSGDTTHFSLTSATSCTSGEVLAAGSSCNIAATFTPTTAPSVSEVFALSASPTVAVSPFTLTLTGIGGTLITTTTTVTPSLNTISYGTSISVVVAVSANTGGGTPAGTLTLTATPSGGTTTTLLNAVTLTNGAYTYTGTLPTGTDSLVATYSGSTIYNASSNTATVHVAPVVPQIIWTPSVITQTYGTAITSGVLDAIVASPAGAIVYTSNISTGGCGTTITTSCYLSVGTYTLTATFTPTDTVDYTTATATISYTVTAAPPLSAYVPRIVMSNHQSLYSGLTNGTYGVAANARGDVFFSDVNANTLDMLPAGSTTPVVLITGMSQPRSVMVDSAGNVYVSDMFNIKVYRVPFVNGTSYPTGVAVSSFTGANVVYCSQGLTTDCRLPAFGTVTGNAAQTTSVAVDGAGNYYGADVSDGVSGGAFARIFKQTPAGVVTIVVDALPVTTNAQIVSDKAGNLYYTDTISLYSIPAGSSTATVRNASSLKNPSGVAFDPAGNLIVSDYGNGRIVVIPIENNSLNFADQYTLAPYSPRCSVGVDAKGTIYYPGNTSGASSINAMQTSVYGVPSLAVGASSTSALVYATFNYPTTFSQYLTIGYGASIGYGANTCTMGGIYGIGQSCSFNTYIKPSRVGPVSGVIGVADASGNYYSQFTLTANATGSAVAIDPGTTTAIGSGFTAPSGVAVDKSGNVFIADTTANTVYELVGGTGTPVALGAGLSGPTGVAVDATGNLFIADTGNLRVVEIPVSGSVLATANQVVVTSTSLTAPIAIAIGPLNSLYIAQSGQLAIYENRGYSLPALSSVISTAFLLPRSLAVDPSGNIFIGDSNTGMVVEIAAYTNTQTNVATGLTTPTGLATDAAGDLFLIDNGTAQAIRIPNISGTLAYAQAVSLGSFTSPNGLGIDELGNLYLSDPSVPAVYKITRTIGAVNLGYSNQGVISSPGSASLLSSGNQSLTLGTPLYTASGDTAHFSVTSATTCVAGQALAAGNSCSLTETFTPTVVGTTSETLALNATPTVTTTPLNVTFSGYGTNQVATTLNVALVQSGSLSYGQSATFTATLTPSQFNVAAATGTVTFTINGAVQKPIKLSGNTASITFSGLSGGANTISATYSGDLNYAVSSSTTLTVNVTPGTTVTTLSVITPFVNPSSAAPGSTVTLTAIVVSSVPGVISGVVNFVSGTTILGSATVTTTTTGSYQAQLATSTIPLGSYNVSAVYLGSLDLTGSSSTTTPLLISAPSILIAANSLNLTSTPSTPGSLTLFVSSVSGLGNGSPVAVVFSCSGLPVDTTCQVVPKGISLSASPNTNPVAPQQVVLTVAVDIAPGTPFPPVSQLSPRGRTTLFFACLLSLPILFRRRSKLRRALLLAFILCLIPASLVLSGCSNKASYKTPTGTTPITITATSTSATTSITVNLTVAN